MSECLRIGCCVNESRAIQAEGVKALEVHREGQEDGKMQDGGGEGRGGEDTHGCKTRQDTTWKTDRTALWRRRRGLARAGRVES